MRIQHNIMAINAHRQLASNQSAVAKNLEKLSSGYKINSAADDAAGLAISEKMRSQITGLTAATKNANDGISLVKTAEGNLQEVHSMLNRMVELATMASNGTYGDTNRAQYAKEIATLNEEIDRISQSANFNGKKLLDGSLSTASATFTLNPTEMKSTSAKDLLPAGVDQIADNVGPITADTEVILHENKVANNKTTFEIDLNNIDYKNNGGTDKLTIKVGQAEVEVELTGDVDTNSKLADAVVAKFAEGGDITPTGGDAKYDVVNENGVLKFSMNNAPALTAADEFVGNFKVETTFEADGDAATAGSINNKDGGPIALGTGNIKEGSLSGGGTLAAAMFTLDTADIKNGAAIKIGSDIYAFATDKETAEALKLNKSVNLVDLSDVEAADIQKEAAKRLTVAATGNKMFDVTATNTDGQISVQERASNTEGDLTTVEGLKEQLKKFSANTLITKNPAAEGTALVLQVGDTDDDYQKMKVSIDATSAKALGLDKVDISTEETAGQAIDIINAAIDKVSDIRAGLGAMSNRLEHTIKNLGVTTENITAAESRIRDVDMAEEMMAFTKNNVLVQAAQSMLAQANVLPQQVLSLLQ